MINAIEYLGYDFVVSNNKAELERCSHIILPGVGAYAKSMCNLKKNGLTEILKELVLGDGKYFLGVCVGMQILTAWGNEFGGAPGLGWIKGKTRKLELEESLNLPHVGWNEVLDYPDNFVLFRDMPCTGAPSFYFVHSYVVSPEEETDCRAYTVYGERFLSALQKANIFGVQFHPEKSQQNGLKLLDNFCSLS